MKYYTEVIQVDTREQDNYDILEYFYLAGQQFIEKKLPAGDYTLAYDYTTVIDLKHSGGSGLMELAKNLCDTKEHARINREIARAFNEMHCTNFIFLVCEDDIKSIDEVHNWKPKRTRYGKSLTRVKPETLEKILKTMERKYGVKFLFCPNYNAPRAILKLLYKYNREEEE